MHEDNAEIFGEACPPEDEEAATAVAGKRVFISGPMSGLPNYNVGAFAEAHARLKEAGAAHVFDPAVEYLDQRPDENRSKTHGDYVADRVHELTTHALRPPFPGDLNDGKYDLLVSLPGWEGSEGARAERAVAEACGIECVGYVDLLGRDGDADAQASESCRLRELVRDMWSQMVHAAWHDEPPCPAVFADRLRELGIEIGE